MHLPHLTAPLVVATIVAAAYTAVVWWLCHPLVKAFIRNPRRRQE